MSHQEMLAKYAEVAIRVGLGLEPGDRLVVDAPTGAIEFVRLLVEEAYRNGAVNVDVLWEDDAIVQARFGYGKKEAAEAVTGHSVLRKAAVDSGDLWLRLASATPDLLASFDSSLTTKFAKVNREHERSWIDTHMADLIPWTGIGVATPTWAQALFPDLEPSQALESLWGAIFRVCRIDRDDPIAAWDEHITELSARSKYLNDMDFDALHYEGPGTSLTLGLPRGHIWASALGRAPGGRRFVPNMPTEEIFTAPDRLRGEGVVTSTRLVDVYGTTVEGLRLRIQHGEVVEANADSGQDALDELLSLDGATRFGEVALVPQSSAVATEGLAWKHMLFDENQASHIALGDAYSTSVKDGQGMTPEQLLDAGLNTSAVHLDFVVGSPNLSISGITTDETEHRLIEGGEWAFQPRYPVR